MAAFSIVALYPTPTNLKMAVWPSDTPRMWFCRYARVVPGINQYDGTVEGRMRKHTPHLSLLLDFLVLDSDICLP